MKAMILAAGRGERMKPLTDTCPKPLLRVKGKSLIEYHIEKLAAIGVKDIVINYAWLGHLLIEQLGDGAKWQLNLHYSDESNGALETAGGIKKALPLLNTEQEDEPFFVINGDVFTDFDFTRLPKLAPEHQAHLWLVDNPEHHSAGDFGLIEQYLVNQAKNMFTFSGIAMYRPSFFNTVNQKESSKLAPLLRMGAKNKQISASKLTHLWVDVGTPQRLAQLNRV